MKTALLVLLYVFAMFLGAFLLLAAFESHGIQPFFGGIGAAALAFAAWLWRRHL